MKPHRRIACQRFFRPTFWLFGLAAIGLSSLCSGCLDTSDHEVIVYVALDREFSEPILKQFEEETGISVRAKYDVESSKTVGLANELLVGDSERARADVFWNNEIMHTLRLKRAGRLATANPIHQADFPVAFVDPGQTWFGFAARARVIIVNTDLLDDEDARPRSVHELADPKWQGQCGIAKPLFGTTSTHAAVLFEQMGHEEATQFFEQVALNAVTEAGNKQVAQHVAAGRYAWGITDTDDAIIELEKGYPVAIVIPDQGENESGCLLIPNTLCTLQGAPNPENAKRLIDFLLSHSIEDQLAESDSAQIPVSSQASLQSRAMPQSFRPWHADFAKAANDWESVAETLQRLFQK
ncbi:MAG: extracellular solute-binding protein [Pirellulaceae bacterium]